MSVMKRERRPMELSWPEDRIDRVFRDMFRDFFTRGIAMDRFFEGWPNPMHVEEFVEGDTWVIRHPRGPRPGPEGRGEDTDQGSHRAQLNGQGGAGRTPRPAIVDVRAA